MQFRVARLNLLVGIQLAEPYLLLAKEAPEVLDQFYRALAPRHRLQLGDLQSFGGNTFADVKLTINIYNRRGKIEVRPDGLIVDLPDLIEANEDLTAIKDFLLTCEQTLLTSFRQCEQSPILVTQRDIRANAWIECLDGAEASDKWLESRGNQALLSPNIYQNMRRDYTLQLSLLADDGASRLGVGVQRSYLDVGHLYLACEQQSYRKVSALPPIDDQFDSAYRDLVRLLGHMGLEII